MAQNSAEVAAAIHHDTLMGHPRGLWTLFLTELWERFGYYGMRALLLLYMVDTARGGLGIDIQTGSAIYGLYTFGVYAFALPGGWVADRLIGQRRAVLVGGVIIALGYYSLALPYLVPGSQIWSFYLGLMLVIFGTGLLKPNVSAIVGDLYAGDEPTRRDAGFSIFYMGINIGAFLGPILCGWVGEGTDWNLGFSLAGIGMTFGLIQYVYGARYLRGAGELIGEAAEPKVHGQAKKQFAIGIAVLVGLALVLIWLARTGIVPITLVGFAQATGVLVLVLSVLYFGSIISFGCHDVVERKRVFVIFLLFIGAAVFWSGFEQAGSSLNLFARDFTDRAVFGWEMPTTWLQSINPIFIILLAPVMGLLWVRLGARSPSIGAKFGAGLILLGVGFLVLAWGSLYVPEGAVESPAIGLSPTWLIATYFFHTVGELALSPVGLSGVTKLAPHRLVGQMMGTWFMGAALGNLIAGLVAGYIKDLPPEQLFVVVAGFVIGFGLLFLLFSPIIKRLTCGVN